MSRFTLSYRRILCPRSHRVDLHWWPDPNSYVENGRA